MKVKIKLSNEALLPKKGESNAMCYDCYAHYIEVQNDGKVFVDLGFSATPPEGYGIRLIPRSNITKYWWVMNNSIGIGDEDYKNNYQARFTPIPIGFIPAYNNGVFGPGSFGSPSKIVNEEFPYTIGDRVCQMEIYKREDFDFEEVKELTGNDRGGGFGSTNLK